MNQVFGKFIEYAFAEEMAETTSNMMDFPLKWFECKRLTRALMVRPDLH